MLNSSVNTACSGMALTSLVGAGVGVGVGIGVDGSAVIVGVRGGVGVASFPMVGVGVVFAALHPKSAMAITADRNNALILFAFKFSSNSMQGALQKAPLHYGVSLYTIKP